MVVLWQNVGKKISPSEYLCKVFLLLSNIHLHMLVNLMAGYGGGFNERENVEYIEREESDGEYDEVSTGFSLDISMLIFFKYVISLV